MKNLLTSMVIGCVLAVGAQAHALSITPASVALVLTGNQTGQGGPNGIDAAIYATIAGSEELYKQNVGETTDLGDLAESYETDFSGTDNDPLSKATITYTGGNIIGGTKFLLVKDGNNSPAWYLFNLTDLEWDGKVTLELSDFWIGNGSISHVSLYGNSTPPPAVPEPGTLLLLGGGLLGMALYGRRRKKA